MSISNENIPSWARWGRYGHTSTSAYEMVANNNGPFGADENRDIPEEYKHFLTAFDANPKSESGRRMQFFLTRMRNGSIGGSLYKRKQNSRAEEIEDQRFTFTFMMLTGPTSMTPVTGTLATEALRRTAGSYSIYHSTLRDMIETARAEHARLTELITSKQSDISAKQASLMGAKTDSAAAERQLAQTSKEINALDSEWHNPDLDAVSLENRAIKIVRDIDSFAEFKQSILEEETKAPDIYVVTGVDHKDGSLIYDKITADLTGAITIESINEKDVPELSKQEGERVTDMIERVYCRTDNQGNETLLRMEHGINGELLGKIGSITDNMLDAYLAKTGKSISEITADADAYEKKINLQLALSETSEAIYRHRHILKDSYKQALESIKELSEHLTDERTHLGKLETEATECSNRIDLLEEHCTHVEQMMDLIQEYEQNLSNGSYCSLEEMMCKMPQDLREEFARNFAAIQSEHEHAHHGHSYECKVGEKGPNPMNAAWAGASGTSNTEMPYDLPPPQLAMESQQNFAPRPL